MLAGHLGQRIIQTNRATMATTATRFTPTTVGCATMPGPFEDSNMGFANPEIVGYMIATAGSA